MDNSRMSTADMLQYCEEALAWEDFGPIDIFFFESVKKILLGQCSATEEPEEVIDDLMGIERPVRDVELEPEYDKYADIYYGEEGDDEIPDYSRSKEDEAFDSVLSGDGGFFGANAAAAANTADGGTTAVTDGGYTLSEESGFTGNSEGAYTFSEDAATSAYSLDDNNGTAADISSAVTESAVTTESAEVSAPAPAPVPVTSVNITVSDENKDLAEDEFNELKESLAAAAAAVEMAMKDRNSERNGSSAKL